MLLPVKVDHDDDATDDEADSAESDDAAPRQQSSHMRCISNTVWTRVFFHFFSSLHNFTIFYEQLPYFVLAATWIERAAPELFSKFLTSSFEVFELHLATGCMAVFGISIFGDSAAIEKPYKPTRVNVGDCTSLRRRKGVLPRMTRTRLWFRRAKRLLGYQSLDLFCFSNPTEVIWKLLKTYHNGFL